MYAAIFASNSICCEINEQMKLAAMPAIFTKLLYFLQQVSVVSLTMSVCCRHVKHNNDTVVYIWQHSNVDACNNDNITNNDDDIINAIHHTIADYRQHGFGDYSNYGFSVHRHG